MIPPLKIHNTHWLSDSLSTAISPLAPLTLSVAMAGKMFSIAVIVPHLYEPVSADDDDTDVVWRMKQTTITAKSTWLVSKLKWEIELALESQVWASQFFLLHITADDQTKLDSDKSIETYFPDHPGGKDRRIRLFAFLNNRHAQLTPATRTREW